MDKYEKLMREIVEYLDGTWLAKARTNHRAPIRGNTEAEIGAAEQGFRKKMPLALKAWYRTAGAVPPYLNDHGADYSLEDFESAQDTAEELTQNENCQWKLDDNIIPFSQRIGMQFFFVNTKADNPDDPPVFLYVELAAQPHQTDVAFTAFIREIWLEWLDLPDMNEEIVRQLNSRRDGRSWLVRRQIANELAQEVREFRQKLINVVHQEDLRRNITTGPRQFQERWLEEFRKSETWKKLQNEGLHVPFGWVDPPQVNPTNSRTKDL